MKPVLLNRATTAAPSIEPELPLAKQIEPKS